MFQRDIADRFQQTQDKVSEKIVANALVASRIGELGRTRDFWLVQEIPIIHTSSTLSWMEDSIIFKGMTDVLN